MRKVNAVIYARYSSHGQTEQSIEGQLHDAYDYASREGYTIVHEYIDRALTGRSDNRADFQRMIADSAKHTFEVVLVWKLDRFARNRYDSAIYKSRLKKNGVKVVSVKESILDSPEGIILEGMLESMAEYYSANLSVNVKRGQRETLAKGRFVGGNIPYGYRVCDGKLVPDEKTAPIVRFIYEQYALGVSKKDILTQLENRGIRSPSNTKLTMTTFHSVLKNPVYIGQYTRAGVVYPDCAQPIITRELYEEVQRKLAKRAQAPAALKAKTEYLLQSKAICGHCGMHMHGESGKSHTGEHYYYYACSGKKKRSGCKKRNERKEYAERYVVEHTVSFVLTPRNIRRISEMVSQAAQAEFALTKIPEMERSVRHLDRELEKLVDALIDAPKIAHPRIYDRMALLEAQKADLEQDIAKQRITAQIQYTPEDVTQWLSQFCLGDINDPAFCRRIIDVFVNSVYFYDDRIVIFYNTRTQSQPQPQITTVTPLTTPTHKGSDSNPPAPPKEFKSEPQIVMIDSVFGFVFMRKQHEKTMKY